MDEKEQQHQKCLNEMCRICGKGTKGQNKRHGMSSVNQYKTELKNIFGIDVQTEDSAVFAKKLCRDHVQLCKRYHTCQETGSVFSTSVTADNFSSP